MKRTQRCSNSPTCGTRRGLTVVELAVVGACVGLLVAIGVPALSQTRERGMQTVCLKNLMTLAHAAAAYSTDDTLGSIIPINKEIYRSPLDSPKNQFEWGGKAGIGAGVWEDNPPQSIPRSFDSILVGYSTKKIRGPAHRPLNPYVYKQKFTDHSGLLSGGYNRPAAREDTQLELPEFHCPADVGAIAGYHYYALIKGPVTETIYNHTGNSYISDTIIQPDPTDLDPSHADRVYSWGTQFRPVSDMPNPAKTIMFQEEQNSVAWLGSEPPAFHSRSWHGRMDYNTMAFIDGHAAVINMFIPRMMPAMLPGYTEQEINTLYDDYILIRTSEWQLDCLPAKPILTKYEN